MRRDTLLFAVAGIGIGVGAAVLMTRGDGLSPGAAMAQEPGPGLAPDEIIDRQHAAASRDSLPQAAPEEMTAAVAAALSGDQPDDAIVTLAGSGERPAYAIPASLAVIEVRPGDTLMNLLTDKGVDRREAHAAIEALRTVFDPRHLRAGQRLALALSPSALGFRSTSDTVGNDTDPAPVDRPVSEAGRDDGPLMLQRVVFRPRDTQEIAVARDADGNFTAAERARALVPRRTVASGTIDSSLYVAADRAGLPPAVIVTMMKPFAYDVDFQRDIRPGDSFTVMYDRMIDPQTGEDVRQGLPAYAELQVGGRVLTAYRFVDDDGDAAYFTAAGRDVRKALLLTPIDGARVSSGYGLRRHPVLGYTKMHRGVDFAAPRGTSIYAAGNGVIDRIGRWGAYGNYIRIRHGSTRYSTAYAHMHRFARGLRKGMTVKQGQVIGFVGSTGRSTGPHLHYEVLRNGKQVNPRTIEQLDGQQLEGSNLARFEDHKRRIDRQIRRMLAERALLKVSAE